MPLNRPKHFNLIITFSNLIFLAYFLGPIWAIDTRPVQGPSMRASAAAANANKTGEEKEDDEDESSEQPDQDASAESAAEGPWLEELAKDTEDGRSARATVGAYVLHVIAAVLRCPEVTNDSERVSQALEVYIWWLDW